MSQKYKNFAKGYGQVTDSGSTVLPPDVKRVGYLRKLKKMKRRFFVLRLESDSGEARLEYYSSEKKWRSGSVPRRCIELKSCLNISRKLHSKQKNVIALYTQDDCFSVVTENSEELDLWLSDILEVQKSYIAADENMRGRPLYEHLWQVVIDKHDLECAQNLTGPYRVALSSKALTLIKMNASDECDYLEFPLMSIRRCGHSKDHFFIELGRSAVTGAGEIYMATEATIIAQNMHETVLSAMKSSKIREDGNTLPRPRSASTSENTNPVATRRPIGIVAPQSTTFVSSSSMLSSSRERCDSLPTRPKTLGENSHGCVLSFSPCSLSSAAGYNSSTEEMDCLKLQSSSYFTLKSVDGTLSSDRPLTEVPDEYLMMSPSEASAMKKSDGYMPMAPGGASEETPVVIQEGYLTMSPTDLCSKQISITSIESDEKNKVVLHQNVNSKDDKNEMFKLEKVPSMLIVTEENKENAADTVLKNNLSNACNIQNDSRQVWISRPTQSCKSPNINIPFPEIKQVDSTNNENLSASKPPIPERSYRKPEFRSNVGPPLPLRKHECCTKGHANTGADSDKAMKSNQNEVKNNLQETEMNVSECIQIEENSIIGKLETFSKNKIAKKLGGTSKVSPDQNTNFSCLVHNEKSTNNFLRCASLCSANKPPYNIQKTDCFRSEQIHIPLQHSISKFSCNKKLCDGVETDIQKNSDTLNVKEPSNFSLPTSLSEAMNCNCIFPTDKDSSSCHHGDYVNLEFKKSGNVNVSQSATENFIHKNNLQMSLNAPSLADPNYTNIHFGKPYCPTPNPIPATLDMKVSALHSSARQDKTVKPEQNFLSSQNVNNVLSNPDDARAQKVQRSPTCSVNSTVEAQKNAVLTPKLRNIPNTLPAFRKQMSAPAAPPSLRPELPSPGRKSSCPVTASASMIKPSLPVTSVNFMRPVLLQSHATTGHLRVSTSRSPDHSSVSSISSASDEISSNHSSPKILTASQNFSTGNRQTLSDCQYENVVIPQKSSTSSRPPSVSSEKELNYASLDLTPSVRDDVPRSPIMQKPPNAENVESLMYAEIDFTKSEGLKNVSGTVRESRL